MTARVAEPMNNYFTGQEVRGFPPKKINIVQCIQNHLSSILLISLCCAVMGATAVWFKVSPLYHAEAKIHFEPVVSKILYNLDKASIAPYYDDYVRTQINIIKSYPILAKSINNYENLEFKWRLSGENLSHAVNRLSTILNVQQIRGTHLLSISMSSTTNMGLADFINIIVFSYMDQLKKNQLAKDSSSLSFLEERKVLLEQELDKKYAELQKTAKKETIGATDERNIYVYLQSVVDIKQALVKARTDRSKMTANLQELRKQKQQLNEIDVSGDVDDWVEKDAAIKDNRIQMSRKLQQMRITFAGMKKDHPDRIQFEKSFEKLVEVQNQMRKRVSEKAESVIRGKMLADQNRLILKVKADYMAAIKIEINLKEELVQAEHKAMDINDKMIRGSTLRKGIKRIQDSLLRIDERADHLEVESRSPGRAQLMDRAQKPVWPSTSRRNKFMLLAGAISLVAGVVFATAREKMDNKVRTTLDIERILGMPPTGFLFDVQDLPEKIERPDKVVLEQPSSIITEQFENLAITFSREQTKYDSKIFTGLSLDQGHGTTTVLKNILYSLNAKSGNKLFIDLSGWSSKKDKGTSVKEKGIWDVLEGRISLKDAILKPAGCGFHVLQKGKGPIRHSALFQELGMEAIIRSLQIDYRFIFIDSPPLLKEADSDFLIQLADVTLLIVGAGKVTDHHLFKMVSRLSKINDQAFSVILNQVRMFSGGYYKAKVENFYKLDNSRKIEVEL